MGLFDKIFGTYSERELKAALTERIKELGIVYNKETKAYEWADKQ